MEAKLFAGIIETIFGISLILTVLFTSLVAADVIDTGLGATITIGNPTTTTTTSAPPVNITIDNPANITFSLVAYDGSQYQQINMTLYDNVGHDFLNSTQIRNPVDIFSPTSIADFQFDYDNKNLDVLVYGLNLTSANGITSQNGGPIRILVNKPMTSIPGVTIYKAYRVELPSQFSNYSSIILKIKLADASGVNYNNITVYRCGNFNSINGCLDSGGWQPQTSSVDSANQLVSLAINRFSVYAVGGGGTASATSTTTTTQTTSTTSQTTSSTSTTTTASSDSSSSSSSSGSSSSSSSSSSGGGGGGSVGGSTTQTTTTTPTTTTTTLSLVIRNESSNGTNQNTQKSSLSFSSLFSLTGQIDTTMLIAGAIVVASIAGIAWFIYSHRESGFGSWKSSYPSYRTIRINTKQSRSSSKSRSKSKRNSRETHLSL